MAAFLVTAPLRGASTTADALARLHRAVQATLDRQAGVRPTLVCHWLQDAHGRLSCHWEIAAPDIPIPPD